MSDIAERKVLYPVRLSSPPSLSRRFGPASFPSRPWSWARKKAGTGVRAVLVVMDSSANPSAAEELPGGSGRLGGLVGFNRSRGSAFERFRSDDPVQCEVRRVLECLREAETLAEKLNDDHRRGRVCALVSNVHSLLGEPDEALVAGTRALEIAGRIGDLRLRSIGSSYLEQLHYYRGDYERVVELASDNLAAMPADEYGGSNIPGPVFDRFWLVLSLGELGRFAEAIQYEAEALRLADSTQRAYAVALAHSSAGRLHLLKGDWAKARSLIEQGIAAFRTGNIVLDLPGAVASSTCALARLGAASEALDRVREAEKLLERQAAGGIVHHLGWAYGSLGHTCLLLGRPDEARRLTDQAVESSPRQPGFAAHALHLLGDVATHSDRFDAESGEAHYRRALALAEPRGMRPLVAHCHLGLGKLYRRTGKREQAREQLTTATTMYREMDMRFWLEQAEAELKEAATPGSS